MFKCRYCPSPSGSQHPGSLKSILYNYYFALKNKGEFYIRIEDTDKTKVTQKAIDNLFKTLDNLDIKYTNKNNVWFQSQRFEIYQKYADELIKKDLAFYCKCIEKENVNNHITRCNCNETSGCIKIKIPELSVDIYDKIYGKVSLDSKKIPNFVLIRADGSPTYNFAVVIDDYLMGITHVIRGIEHLLNTHKQYIIYKAFGWDLPFFAHYPVVIDENKKKLSKSRLDISIEEILSEGVDPDSLKNYIMSLGSNIGLVDSEIDIINKFKLEDIKKSPTIFDIEKLKKFSQEYLKKYSDKTRENLRKFGLNYFNFDIESVDKRILREFVIRSRTYKEVFNQLSFLFKDQIIFKQLDLNQIKIYKDELEKILWVKDDILNYINQKGLQNTAKIFRQIVLGSEIGPNIIDIFSYLPKDFVLKKFDFYIQYNLKL